jgi:transglutaminase-like putative cysteine protease
MMTHRSFFRRLCQRKIISLIGLVAAAIVVLVLAWTPARVHADTAPEWLRLVAQDSLPKYSAETVAVTLISEQQTIVKENGDIETHYRRAYKLLRPEAREHYGSIAVTFDNETKVLFLKAWTITSTGQQIELKEKDAVESGMTGYELYSDMRTKYLKFPEANVGSVVGYEFVQKHRPFVFEDNWSFQGFVPTRKARFSLQIPPGWEFTNYWANYPEQKSQSAGANQYTWEVNDLPAVEVEPHMPPMLAVAGRMDIKYFPRDPKLRAKTTGTWNDLGIWYAGLSDGRREATPAIKQKVTELTAGMSDDAAKMRALTSYLQRQVRYVAIEIGIGGYQPHSASDVFTHQYGDCKDKVTLLSAMLKEIGIESFYVLVDVERGVVNPEFPSTRFNHAILAIKLPDSVKDPSLYAVVSSPKLGRLLFFDPTNEYVPLGYLPSYLQDNFALVVTADGGTLISMPVLPPATNRLLRTAQMSVSPSGRLAGEVREIRWGQPAVDSRERFLQSSPADRQKVIEDFLGESLSNFALTSATVGNLEIYDENLTLDYKFAVQGYAKMAGDLLILHPRIVGGKGSSLLTGKPRKYPIEFEQATRQDDIFDIALPAGYVVDDLPPPVRAECEYGTYKSDVQVTDNILHYKRTFEITRLHVPTKDLNDVRDFFQQIAQDEKSSAVLKRSNP